MNLIPPQTGNEELDTFLYQLAQMLAGAEQASSTPLPGGYSPSGNLIEYPFRYVHVKFADDNIGTGMSNSPTGKLYYGLFNSPSSVESVNPADYTWVLVSGGGMGTTKNFWYRTIGGSYLDFAIASASPGNLFTIDTGGAIDLNVNVSAEDLIGRVAFAKAATQQLASAPYNVATLGSTSFPAAGTWGFAEVWQGTPPIVTGNEILFQLDGVYNASTNTTVWSAPYLAAFKVGQLSAIQANLGFVTAGEARIGTNPEISGTTMTGSGAHFYPDGRFVLGKPAQNVVYNGSDLYLNGFKAETFGDSGILNIYSGAAISDYTTQTDITVLPFVANTPSVLVPGTLGIALNFSVSSTTLIRFDVGLQMLIYDTVTASAHETIGNLRNSRWIEDTVINFSRGNDFAAISTIPLVLGRTYQIRVRFFYLNIRTQSTGAPAAICDSINIFGACQVQQLRL